MKGLVGGPLLVGGLGPRPLACLKFGPAPLYLWAYRCYTNPLYIIIIITNAIDRDQT